MINNRANTRVLDRSARTMPRQHVVHGQAVIGDGTRTFCRRPWRIVASSRQLRFQGSEFWLPQTARDTREEIRVWGSMILVQKCRRRKQFELQFWLCLPLTHTIFGQHAPISNQGNAPASGHQLPESRLG